MHIDFVPAHGAELKIAVITGPRVFTHLLVLAGLIPTLHLRVRLRKRNYKKKTDNLRALFGFDGNLMKE